MNNDQAPVLVCKDLCISYYTRAGEIPAVVDFSLTVKPGETIGIVGESGCGKSTVAMAIMQHMGANGGIKSGSITFKGRDLTQLSDSELRHIRGSEIAMIYQEPFASLNPSLKISTQLMEVPLAHESISKEEARQRAVQMLGMSNCLILNVSWTPILTSCQADSSSGWLSPWGCCPTHRSCYWMSPPPPWMSPWKPAS